MRMDIKPVNKPVSIVKTQRIEVVTECRCCTVKRGIRGGIVCDGDIVGSERWNVE